MICDFELRFLSPKLILSAGILVIWLRQRGHRWRLRLCHFGALSSERGGRKGAYQSSSSRVLSLRTTGPATVLSRKCDIPVLVGVAIA